MGMMMLAASQGAQIVISTDGADETKAIKSLSNLVTQGFNE